MLYSRMSTVAGTFFFSLSLGDEVLGTPKEEAATCVYAEGAERPGAGPLRESYSLDRTPGAIGRIILQTEFCGGSPAVDRASSINESRPLLEHVKSSE